MLSYTLNILYYKYCGAMNACEKVYEECTYCVMNSRNFMFYDLLTYLHNMKQQKKITTITWIVKIKVFMYVDIYVCSANLSIKRHLI